MGEMQLFNAKALGTHSYHRGLKGQLVRLVRAGAMLWIIPYFGSQRTGNNTSRNTHSYGASANDLTHRYIYRPDITSFLSGF